MELANLSKTDILFDAYCGVGTIGLVASDKVAKVIGVELVKDAVNDAIYNAKMNNVKNIHFFCDDASNFMKNMAVKKEKVDVVIMDPPRKGSDAKFLNAVVKLAPKKVFYISCDPRTQVVDLKHLLDNGYQIMAIQPVDMFPFTNHVECVCLLSRR
jgi:23S rRNA (uracil1939-C5)-methyltransferase